MNDIEIYRRKTFDDIKHIDENGNEFWEARELQEVLEYCEWRKFRGVIEKAKSACELSDFNVFEQLILFKNASFSRILRVLNIFTSINITTMKYLYNSIYRFS